MKEKIKKALLITAIADKLGITEDESIKVLGYTSRSGVSVKDDGKACRAVLQNNQKQ